MALRRLTTLTRRMPAARSGLSLFTTADAGLWDRSTKMASAANLQLARDSFRAAWVALHCAIDRDPAPPFRRNLKDGDNKAWLKLSIPGAYWRSAISRYRRDTT